VSTDDRSPRAIAILSLVLAGIMLLVFPWVLVGFVPGMIAGLSAGHGGGVDPVPFMFVGMRMSAVLMVMSGGLIAVAVGLLRGSSWARAWCVRWAIVALGAVVVTALMLRNTLLPLGGDAVANGFVAVYAALLAPYPLVLLVLFGRRR
jgi:hypothetical protein